MAQLIKCYCRAGCDGLAFRIARVWISRAAGALKCPVCGGEAAESQDNSAASLSDEQRKSIHETVDNYVRGERVEEDMRRANRRTAKENGEAAPRHPPLPPPPSKPWVPPVKRAVKKR